MALERDRRAQAREQAIRARGREAMRRLLRERDRRLQPLLERAGAPEEPSLEALIGALAGQEPSSRVGPQPAAEAMTARLRAALAAAQGRLATLTAAHKDQRLSAQRQQQRLSARLEAAQSRIAGDAEARRARGRTAQAQSEKRARRAAADAARSARADAARRENRSVWSVLRRWLGRARPRR